MTNRKSKRLIEPATLSALEGRINLLIYVYETGTNAAPRKRVFANLLKLETQRKVRFGIPAPDREFDRRR
jgi:hypothetical protein